MIDVKQAIQIAKAKAEEMLGPGPYALEEIERESYRDRDVWSITLSAPLLNLAQFKNVARYKRFFIDAETGELIAMKLREVA